MTLAPPLMIEHRPNTKEYGWARRRGEWRPVTAMDSPHYRGRIGAGRPRALLRRLADPQRDAVPSAVSAQEIPCDIRYDSLLRA